MLTHIDFDLLNATCYCPNTSGNDLTYRNFLFPILAVRSFVRALDQRSRRQR